MGVAAEIVETAAKEVGQQLISSTPQILSMAAKAVASQAGAFVSGPGGTVVVAAPKIAAAAAFVALHPVGVILGGVAILGLACTAVAALTEE